MSLEECNIRVEVVKEGDHVEAELVPALVRRPRELASVQYGRRVVERERVARRTVDEPAHTTLSCLH